MANLDTTAEILKSVLLKCGELQDGTSKYHSIALSYINETYQKIIAGSSEYGLDVGEPWIWARGSSPLIITLLPFIGQNTTAAGASAGTIALTYGSTSGTFSTPPQVNSANISVQGWWIQLVGSYESYRIATHTLGATSFTIDGPFNDATVTAASFSAFQIDYTLTASEVGGISRLAGPMIVYRNQTFDSDQEGKIYGSSDQEFKKDNPLHLIEIGVPNMFCITSDSDGIPTVRFNKYVDAATRVEIPYIPVPVDLTENPDTTPIIPRRFRHALVWGPAEMLARDKYDDRADAYEKRFSTILEAMKRDDSRVRDKTSKNRGRLVPRPDLLHRQRKIYNI